MRIRNFFSLQVTIVVILILLTSGITLQSLLKKKKHFEEGGKEYTHYNNYVIFKQSYHHLKAQKDLYALYPEEHWDLYKYSPGFALLMAPFAMLPDGWGLLFWNLLNVLILFVAFWKLPLFADKSKIWMLALIFLELITSTQNSQSNGLIAGLLILIYILLEKDYAFIASLCLMLTVFIKLFGIVGLVMFLFYPKKLRSAAYLTFWGLVFLALPLLICSFDQSVFLYKSWFRLLQNDHGISTGISVAGWLQTWFHIEAKTGIVGIGVILFCIPLIRLKQYKDSYFRLLYLCSVLIWVIIFNHRAESATYIIAVSGVSLWYFGQSRSALNTFLLILAIVLTILSPTDLFPKYLRQNYVIPYVLKAVPCILIWFKIVYDLMRFETLKYSNSQLHESESLDVK